MKTLLHTADGKQYSYAYISVFSVARALLREEIRRDIDDVRGFMTDGFHPSLYLLVTIANEITAYNELSSLSFFLKTKDF